MFWAAVIGWPLVWFPDLPWARGDPIHLGALQGMVAGLLVALPGSAVLLVALRKLRRRYLDSELYKR